MTTGFEQGLQSFWLQATMEFDRATLAFHAFIAANVDTATYLPREPLVTINAVGVAMALFALEQRLVLNRQLRSRDAAKRSKLARRALDATFFAGLPHMASIIWVLLSRYGCEDTCPTGERVLALAYATNYTFMGMGVLLIAIALLVGDMYGAPVRYRQPPSIMAPDQSRS